MQTPSLVPPGRHAQSNDHVVAIVDSIVTVRTPGNRQDQASVSLRQLRKALMHL